MAADGRVCCAICLHAGARPSTTLDCGHAFCTLCLTKHLRAQRNVNPASAHAACPLCNVEVEPSIGAMPPAPCCARCNMGRLSLRGTARVDSLRCACDVCLSTIPRGEVWLRCSACDYDVCSPCCARLGVAGVEEAQLEASKAAASLRGRLRSAWRRARLLGRDRVGLAAGTSTQRPDGGAEARGGAAFEVYAGHGGEAQHERRGAARGSLHFGASRIRPADPTCNISIPTEHPLAVVRLGGPRLCVSALLLSSRVESRAALVV